MTSTALGPTESLSSPQTPTRVDVRWMYTGALRQTLRADLRHGGGTGNVRATVDVLLDVQPGAAEGQWRVEYRVLSVPQLSFDGDMDPTIMGLTVGDREAALLALSGSVLIDDQGHALDGTRELSNTQRDALGPSLQALARFIGLPALPKLAQVDANGLVVRLRSGATATGNGVSSPDSRREILVEPKKGYAIKSVFVEVTDGRTEVVSTYTQVNATTCGGWTPIPERWERWEEWFPEMVAVTRYAPSSQLFTLELSPKGQARAEEERRRARRELAAVMHDPCRRDFWQLAYVNRFLRVFSKDAVVAEIVKTIPADAAVWTLFPETVALLASVLRQNAPDYWAALHTHPSHEIREWALAMDLRAAAIRSDAETRAAAYATLVALKPTVAPVLKILEAFEPGKPAPAVRQTLPRR
ncbi:MAG: hypothetical protein JKY37_15225 [Nannocystaceae bacterium]|nr:hypothetical protein [Nannocystaceae bacterium]